MKKEKLHLIPITPVHISNNTALQEGKDFYIDGMVLHRIDYPFLLSLIPDQDFDSSLSQIKSSGIQALLSKARQKEKKGKEIDQDWKQILKAKIEEIEKRENQKTQQNSKEKTLLDHAEIYQCTLDFGYQNLYNKIQEIALDSLGRSFISGSTLKGMMRTALYFSHLSQFPKALSRLRFTWTEDDKEADYPLFLEMTGMLQKNSHQDFFQQLRIQDSNLLPGSKSVKVYQIKLLNVCISQQEKQVFWKKGLNQNTPFHEEAESLCWEMIIPQTEFQTEIALDKALQKILSKQNQKPAFALEIPTIMQSLKTFGISIAKKEWEFAQKYQISFLMDFYHDILEKAQKAIGGKEAYIPIGSGVPWHGKTIGNLLDSSSLDSIRRHFYKSMGKFVHTLCQSAFHGQNLRKEACPSCGKLLRPEKLFAITPYPKTRHIVFQDGKPCLPAGWIRIAI
ncbi:MAG: type III-A CRISPR-associated RAMP protein Csm5 [Candidatus Brocadiae bacterium]|nr:type III-A CRISPR-associated RAMP protein Csm5 [Candidatus Brocadiia bacterium]